MPPGGCLTGIAGSVGLRPRVLLCGGHAPHRLGNSQLLSPVTGSSELLWPGSMRTTRVTRQRGRASLPLGRGRGASGVGATL